MIQWEYQITLHAFPEIKEAEEEQIIHCDQVGQCFVHDSSRVGVGWLETILHEMGKKGWELVQSGYHHRELLCIWKKRKKGEEIC